MDFAGELERVLPEDLPERAGFIRSAARHLDLIVEANRSFNLTRITGPREAAVKHVLDSIWPWRRFGAARHVVDAGSGAGFPGIPLAILLPDTRFTLSESIGKKARFVESAVAELRLANVDVTARRAEDVLRDRRADIVTARAVAPLARAIPLFAPAIRLGTRALLYKGRDAEGEINSANAELKKHRFLARVADRFTLPDEFGERTLIEVAPSSAATIRK